MTADLRLVHTGTREPDGHLYSLPGELEQAIDAVVITDGHGDGRIVIGCYDATGTQIAELRVLPEVLSVSPAVRRAITGVSA